MKFSVGEIAARRGGFARTIFLLWAAGVPLLAFGLAVENRPAIASSATLLVSGVSAGALYVRHIVRAASAPEPV